MADDDALGDPDDDELDWLLDEWDQADRAADELLVAACEPILRASAPQPDLAQAAARLRAGVEESGWPFGYFLEGCGWRRTTPDGDDELWMQAARATISPPNDPGTDPDEQAAVMSLMHADWFGMVAGLVRRGPGAKFDGPSAVRDINKAPEIVNDTDDPEGDEMALGLAATVLTPLWQALGILDEDARVTRLGVWGLPHALHAEWSETTDD